MLMPGSTARGPDGRVPASTAVPAATSLARRPVRLVRCPSRLKKRRWPHVGPAANWSRLLSMTVALVPSGVASSVSTAGSPGTDW